MHCTKSYTSSGIKRPPQFTRENYRFLNGFEDQFLFPNKKFTKLSPAQQELIQFEAQTMLFSWMEQKRSVKEITTHYAKRLMYADIVEILFAKKKKKEIFGFLSRDSAPAFQDFQDLGIMDVGGEEVKDGMTPKPFFEFHDSGLGVIPSLSSSSSITLSVPALYSRSLGCVHDASVSMPMQFPFLDLESFDSLMFPSDSLMTFPPQLSPIRHFEKDVTMCPMSVIPKESFLKILANADVSETLRKISETQAQISLVFNQEPDALLGPCDYTNQM